jgi:TPR repeat protein
MYRLGTLYANGKGTKRDYRLAHEWFQQASRFGFPDAGSD